jgi:hypothetical protein
MTLSISREELVGKSALSFVVVDTCLKTWPV